MIAVSDLEQRILEIAQPVTESMGLEVVRVRFDGATGGTLQIMIDRADGGTTIDDCSAAGTALSAALGVDDPIDPHYVLEVSSPGIDRPLTRLTDFDAWRGFDAVLQTREPIAGRRRFKGLLNGTCGDVITLECDGEVIELAFSALGSARLVLTDALIKATNAD